jgi:hypothetical protein
VREGCETSCPVYTVFQTIRLLDLSELHLPQKKPLQHFEQTEIFSPQSGQYGSTTSSSKGVSPLQVSQKIMTPSGLCFLTISAPHSRQVLLSMAASPEDEVFLNPSCQKFVRFYTLKLKIRRRTTCAGTRRPR